MRTWRLIGIPIAILVFFIATWIMTAVLGTWFMETRPLSYLILALWLTPIAALLWWLERRVEQRIIEDNELLQKTPQAIARLNQAASTSTTRQELIDALKNEIQELFGTQTFNFALHHTRTQHYDRDVEHRHESLDAQSPLALWLVEQPVCSLIPVPSSEAPMEAQSALALLKEQQRVQIITLGKHGWLELGAPAQAAAYNETQLNILKRLAQAAIVGLDRAAMVEGQAQRMNELESLYWITQAVTFNMPLDDILELLYTQLKRVMPIPNFYVALKNAERETLYYAFFAEGDERLYLEDEWPLSDGLTGLILRTGMTIRTDDYLDECRRRDVTPGSRSRTRHAWLGTPIMTADDKSIGVMVTASDDPEVAFSQEDEGFFVTVAAHLASLLERQNLYTEMETHARQLAAINEIGQLLGSSLDLEEVLDLVVRNAAKLLQAEAGSLLLLDEESGDLIFRITSGPAGDKLVGLKIPSGKGIAGTCFAENRPMIINNVHQDKRWYGNFDERSEFTTQSILAVPLNARGRTIGVLEAINRKDERPFDSQDTELLMSFGAQAAIAIENARLFTMTDQALQERVEELTTIQQIDRQLNATLDYREVMGQTLDWAIRKSGANIGVIAALHEEEDGTRGLHFLAQHGYPQALTEQYLEDELWPLDRGLIGRTVRTGRANLVPDVSEDASYIAVVEGMTAQLTVPIQREDRVIGVIGLEAESVENFSDECVGFVTRLADHAAIAIDNARLFQQVQRANQAKTEFISFVSHELKQPMTSMKGYTDLLMKGIGGQLNEQQMQFLKVVRANATRMDEMVSELLDVSRIESGRMQLNMSSVQPADLITEVVRLFEKVTEAKGQQLVVDMATDLPSIHGDRSRLLQVLSNLISNANKYTPEGGTITICAEQLPGGEGEPDRVRFSVADTGVGMTPDELERLFTKYFRSNNPAVRGVPGTGLGLVITRSIVEMHGGEMKVESAPGEGSTFSFAVPVEDLAQENPAPTN